MLNPYFPCAMDAPARAGAARALEALSLFTSLVSLVLLGVRAGPA